MAAVTPALARPFSLYLDACRLGAAVLVALSHFSQYGLITVPPDYWLLNLGRESVMVFFVLSGFVIAYTTQHKQPGLRDYVLARCTRIYSVALPLLLLSFLVAGALLLYGRATLTALYPVAQPWLYLPLHLLFLGELWGLSEVPPLLAPWWSLGYEVWYYVLFGALYYLRGRRRIVLTAGLLLLMGPKLWLLLPVWASGVWLYHWQQRLQLPRPLAWLGWYTTLVLLALYKESGLDVSLRSLGSALWPLASLPLHSADRYLADYLVCVLVLLNFLCASSLPWRQLCRIAVPVRQLAAYTFTLYLTHALILNTWRFCSDHVRASALELGALAVLIVGATWLIGQLTERRKDWVRVVWLAQGAHRDGKPRAE